MISISRRSALGAIVILAVLSLALATPAWPGIGAPTGDYHILLGSDQRARSLGVHGFMFWVALHPGSNWLLVEVTCSRDGEGVQGVKHKLAGWGWDYDRGGDGAWAGLGNSRGSTDASGIDQHVLSLDKIGSEDSVVAIDLQPLGGRKVDELHVTAIVLPFNPNSPGFLDLDFLDWCELVFGEPYDCDADNVESCHRRVWALEFCDEDLPQCWRGHAADDGCEFTFSDFSVQLGVCDRDDPTCPYGSFEMGCVDCPQEGIISLYSVDPSTLDRDVYQCTLDNDGDGEYVGCDNYTFGRRFD